MPRRRSVCIKHDEFCIKKDEICINKDDFCINKDDFCIKKDEFLIKNDELCIQNGQLDSIRSLLKAVSVASHAELYGVLVRFCALFYAVYVVFSGVFVLKILNLTARARICGRG